MRGSYKPYTGDDYKALYDRTQADGKTDDPPEGLRSLAADYVRGYSDPSELLLEAHSAGTSINGIDRAIQQAAASEGKGEAWQGYSINSEEGDHYPSTQAEENASVQKLEKLDEASEATKELVEGKKELAEGKAELAEKSGDEADAEKANEGIADAAKKGIAAIKGKAGAAKKIAMGAVLGQGLTNLEQATGGKASYNLSALDSATSQTQQAETKTDTADDMKKRLEETAEKKPAEKNDTVNLGTWGGVR